MNELSIEAKLENMGAVMDFVNKHLMDCSPKVCNQIGIAIDEVFSNIANYAYSEMGDVVIRISVGDEVVIEFEDKGVPYNPLERADLDAKAVTRKRQVGGLGLFMVNKIMSAVEYRREENKNILTIKKEK
ncbi:MAG: ATP-binding protein [Chitinispirillales bacterium]|jgi:anti-sigma regulatory factor (Ser/Thr protein kinase)|nr:ATP-binding protein [Chitinispirillales bacterium]